MAASHIELYVVRHGLAEARGDEWPDDAKRPLTEDGMNRLRKIARGLLRLNVTIEVLLTSPLVRAKQTAEIIAAGLDPRPHITTVESLAPGSSFAALVADLEKQAKRKSVGLVGHEPSLGEMAARLAGSKHPFEFKKGGVCRIDVDGLPPTSPGTLRWFLSPKILKSVK